MSDKYLSAGHDTTWLGSHEVLITHPYHPLHGKRLEVVRILQGVRSGLMIRMPDGTQARVPRNWTDYESSQDGQAATDASHLLDIRGLHQAARIIALINSIPSDGS
jgi:hypothetical protein